jgi:sugar-specific transcriptional regulator TrmB
MVPKSGSKDEETRVLKRLGLTITQARTYLALCRTGASTPKTISTESQIARQDIYRILAELQEIGLIEKAITTKTMFKALPLQDALLMLLERRVKETSELQAEARELLSHFEENHSKAALKQEEAQFVLVSEKEWTLKKRKEVIETAQTSIDVVTPWKRYLPARLAYTEENKKAVERGVKIRFITERPDDAISLGHAKEITQVFGENPSVEVRYSRTPIITAVAMWDNKEVLVFTAPKAALGKSPALCSSNPSLVHLVQNYFEMMWSAALDDKNEEL